MQIVCKYVVFVHILKSKFTYNIISDYNNTKNVGSTQTVPRRHSFPLIILWNLF
jgi:hypothetical protein